jgi:hypothetical protein
LPWSQAKARVATRSLFFKTTPQYIINHSNYEDSSNGCQIAFFNVDLEEEIYIEQPEGFTQEGEHFVCKLHKSLYELKQSSKTWNQKLDVFLKNIEFLMWEMSNFSLSCMSMISS